MNTMSSLFFLLPFAVVFLTFQPHLTVAHQTNGTSSLITEVCQNSTHKEFCISILQSSPRSQTADLKGLLFIALKVAAKNASDTSAYIKQNLNDKGLNPAADQSLTDCDVNYADAVDQIDDAVVALSVDAYPDINKWVKAAITDVDSCEAQVQGVSGNAMEVSHSNHTLRLILNIALARLNHISIKSTD
ncbi:hypothetical protein F0562_000827 [Nyssa sinensis]|uniref:Pectinesterase inhibitor domain-containing protein n=1 Tax=Nyssa sinensis TaxID=561372 RepID=A0A5J5C179_9ASTE|nr:hypothetical protein F0562_000827 [Nyssa sinensis]